MKQRSKIYVRLAGGLGNQLFQISAGLRLLDDCGSDFSELILLTDSLTKYGTERSFDAKHIAEHLGLTSSRGITLCAPWVASQLRIARFCESFCGVRLISDRTSINSYPTSRAYLLDGYFQEIRNARFLGDFAAVRALIAETASHVRRKLELAPSELSVHVRRGDYLDTKKTKGIYRVLAEDYYDSAIGERRFRGTGLVFSDDNATADKFANRYGLSSLSGAGLSVWEEFCLMSDSDTIVAANSTFSWWAAFFSAYRGSQSFFPANWFNSSECFIGSKLFDPSSMSVVSGPA